MIRHIVMWNLHDQAEGATASPGMDCTNDWVLHMLINDAQVLAA